MLISGHPLVEKDRKTFVSLFSSYNERFQICFAPELSWSQFLVTRGYTGCTRGFAFTFIPPQVEHRPSHVLVVRFLAEH